jgi:hypothetical protein
LFRFGSRVREEISTQIESRETILREHSLVSLKLLKEYRKNMVTFSAEEETKKEEKTGERNVLTI